MPTQPYPFQEECIQKIQDFSGRALLALEMGLGKSLCSLTFLLRNPEIKRAIVVCPASLKYMWQHEAAHHVNIPATILSTRKAPKRKSSSYKPRLLIINYEILAWWIDWLQDYSPDLVIFDEGHKLGNFRNKWTKAARKLAKDIPHMLILSGTPLVSKPAELWSSLNLIRADLYPKFTPFAFRHCQPRKAPWGWSYNGAARLDELHSNLTQQMMIRKRKEEVLSQLPPKQRIVVPLDLQDRKEYHHAVKDFIGWLYNISPSLARRAAKIEQLARVNYLKRLIAKLKAPAAYDWIEDFLMESEDKLLLYAIHKKVLDGLEERFSNLSIRVDGRVTGRNRQLAFDKFNTDKKTRLFLGNIEAAGVGWSCRSTSDVAHLEFPWVPGKLSQADDRVRGLKRGIEGKPMRSYCLVARDTIELDLLKLLEKKQGILNKVLDGGKGEDLDIVEQIVQKLTDQNRSIPTNTRKSKKERQK